MENLFSIFLIFVTLTETPLLLSLKQVIISVKKSDGDGFLYETTTASSNADLISELCEIWNARLRVRILAPGLRELGKYGPMKKVVSATLDRQYAVVILLTVRFLI